MGDIYLYTLVKEVYRTNVLLVNRLVLSKSYHYLSYVSYHYFKLNFLVQSEVW